MTAPDHVRKLYWEGGRCDRATRCDSGLEFRIKKRLLSWGYSYTVLHCRLSVRRDMHRSYRPIRPTQSRLLQQKWDQDYYEGHRRRVRYLFALLLMGNVVIRRDEWTEW